MFSASAKLRLPACFLMAGLFLLAPDLSRATVSDWKGSSSSGSGDWGGGASFWSGGKPVASVTSTAAFGATGFPTSGTVSLNDSTFTSGSPDVLDVITGTWTFTDNLKTGIWSSSQAFGNSTIIFGDGAGNTPQVTITGTSGATPLAFVNITLGANGSSGNQLGTTTPTITLTNISFNSGPNLNIGSTVGGGQNVLRITSGSTLDKATVGNITINTDGLTENDNSIEISGATITPGQFITLNGFINGATQAKNTFIVDNGGTVNVTTAGGNFSVGAGTSLLVETGGSFKGGIFLSVTSGGTTTLNGANGGASLEVGGGEVVDNGVVSLLNGAVVTSSNTTNSNGILAVNAGAVFQMDGGSTFTNNSRGDASITGTMQMTNGSQFTDNAAPTASASGAFLINTGGSLLVSGGSTLTKANNALAIGTGATMQVTTGSTVTLAGFTLPPPGALTVDGTSTFTFGMLGGLTGGKGTNTLQVNGTMIWSGAGGVSISHDSHGNSDANLVLPSGTGLVLNDGDYELGSAATTMQGSLEVQSGAVLSGGGEVGVSPQGQAGTLVQLDAGSTLNLLLPGNVPAQMTIGSGGIDFVGAGSVTVNLPVLDSGLGDFGQIITTNIVTNIQSATPASVVLNPQFDPNFASDLTDNLPVGTVFQFFAADADGDPTTIPNIYQMTVSQASKAQLAQAGLQWDATNFYSTGALAIAAIPNAGLKLPSTNLDLWRGQHFGTTANTGSAADTATPVGDGVSNLMKYATGQDPNALGTQPGTVTKSSDGLNLIFTYTRNPAADGEVQETVQWSPDMQTWSTTGIREVVTPQTTTSELVTDTVPIGSNTRMYMELVVSR